MDEDVDEYARNRWRRLAPQRDKLWGHCISLHDPAMLHRLHNVVYPDLRHFFCPASWTDEGWARHGGKQMVPHQVDQAVRAKLDAGTF